MGKDGILITSDSKIKERALLLGHYNKRCKIEIDKNSEYYKYYMTGKGMKLRAHPIAIRIANEQFKKLNSINSKKQEFANLMIEKLSDIRGIEVLRPNNDSINSWYSILFKYNESEMGGITRERFVEALHAEGAVEIDIPNSTCPLHTLELFNSTHNLYSNYNNIKHNENEFTNANIFFNSIIKLPVYYEEYERDIVIKYIRAIKKVSNNIKELM
ncbi:MAG: DegT/DnrJ/EryC1/StrS family aminotransferase [Tissierellia bacterium]|nr:DegT/DnrJ/EryC1/StrS family aminotransferase [Tissierellia bacterium]